MHPSEFKRRARQFANRRDEYPNTHDLKTWPKSFAAILRGDKRHEFRREDDKTFYAGEILNLQEYQPHRKRFTGRRIVVLVTYVARNQFGIPKGYAVMSIEPHFAIACSPTRPRIATRQNFGRLHPMAPAVRR